MTNTEVNTYLARYCGWEELSRPRGWFWHDKAGCFSRASDLPFNKRWDYFQIPFQKAIKDFPGKLPPDILAFFWANDPDTACIALIRAIEELKQTEQ